MPRALLAAEESPVSTLEDRLEVVLVVDSDPLRRELVTQGIRLHDCGLETLEAASMVDALELLERHPIAVVVAAAVDAVRLGFRASQIRQVARAVPLIGLLDERVAGSVEGVDRTLGRPLDLDQLLAHLGELLEATESVVRGLPLEALLQLLGQERKSCRVLVEGPERRGIVHLVAGRLVHAETREASGKAALFAMLEWRGAPLRVRERSGPPVTTIEDEVSALLLEHAIARDTRAFERA